MPKLSSIRLDENLVQEGREFPWPPGPDPVYWVIARAIGTKEWRASYKELAEAIAEEHKREPNAEEESEIACVCIARHVLVGWRGLLGDDDQPLPYSPEKARELLRDPGLNPDFLNFVWECASERENFVAQADARVEKN